MVGIVIEHDLVAVPQPIIGVSVVGIRDTEKESAEPKTPGAAATESIDMAPADAARESPMFERPVEVVRRIIASRIMPYPLVIGMDVRSFRMSGLIRETAVARRAALLDATRFLLSSAFLLTHGLLLRSRRFLRASGRWTMRRDMAAANPAGAAASRLIPSLLCHTNGQRNRRGQENDHDFFQWEPPEVADAVVS
jgi:hypothetical protein